MVVAVKKQCVRCEKEFILRCVGEICNSGLFCSECAGKPC